MSARIELPGADGLHAGVRFTDGQATVDHLGPNVRKYFTSAGATITDLDPAPDPTSTLKVGDRYLTTLTIPELRELAQIEGIDLPTKATKPEILHAFLVAFMQED